MSQLEIAKIGKWDERYVKKAIKAERAVLCKKIDAPDISIFNSKQEPLQKMSASLEENTEEAPYFFALPS